MTGKCSSITEHVRLKNPEHLQLQAFAATASAAAFLVIDSVDPDGVEGVLENLQGFKMAAMDVRGV